MIYILVETSANGKRKERRRKRIDGTIIRITEFKAIESGREAIKGKIVHIP